MSKWYLMALNFTLLNIYSIIDPRRRNQISKRLITVRKQKGYRTAASFAYHYGIDPDLYKNLEHGRQMSIENLSAVLEKLGLEYSDFFKDVTLKE